MAGTTYRPPRDCPVCRSRLQLTQLGCPTCDTALSGRFEQCSFCGLSDDDLDVLRVFLASRGNMKDLERHLGVSYPTARARFDDLLGRLGLLGGPASAAPSGDGDDHDGARDDEPVPWSAPDADPRRAALEALARGEIDVVAAREAIAPAPPAAPTGTPAKTVAPAKAAKAAKGRRR